MKKRGESKGKKKEWGGAGKIAWYSSMKVKTSILVCGAVLVTAVALLGITISSSKTEISETTKNYIYDVTVARGQMLDMEIKDEGTASALSKTSLENLMAGIGVQGVDSSYIYVVSSDSTMLYHPTAEKIGSPVENSVVKGIAADLKAGKVPEPDIVSYLFKGVTKYAGYYITENKEAIVVLSADEDEVLAPIQKVRNTTIVLALIIFVVVGVIAVIVASGIAKSMMKVTAIVDKVAKLDLSVNDQERKLSSRKDEAGAIFRAVETLRTVLVEMVRTVKAESDELATESLIINENAEKTFDSAGQVEKAVNEMADGASSQAEETQKATENVIYMGEMVQKTNEEVVDLNENATEIRESNGVAMKTLQELDEINNKALESIDMIYEQTNTTNESVNEIQESLTLITSIAEQTNLLSLNASIEAARAGEQGKGFAVVASEIQKLAEQSNESAQEIERIVRALIQDSAKAVEIMNEVKEIMRHQSENVERTSEVFHVVQNGLEKSIAGIGLISERTKSMDESRIQVVDIVQNLSAIAEENAAGTQETAASVTEVGSAVGSIAESAKKLKEITNILNEHMSKFGLD